MSPTESREETEFEARLRAALRYQANRAPDPDRVRNALYQHQDREPRFRKSVVLVAAVAAVVAIGAIGLPTGLHLLHDRVATNRHTTVGAASSEPLTTAPAASNPLTYRPGWLPSGFREGTRGGLNGTIASRTWFPAGQDNYTSTAAGTVVPSINITVMTRAESGMFDQDAASITNPGNLPTTTVNGHPGVTLAEQLGTPPTPLDRVLWMPDANTVLSVTVIDMPDGLTVAQRVADSVKTDTTAVLQDPFSPSSAVPGGAMLAKVSVQGTGPSTWTAAAETSEVGGVVVTVALGTSDPATGGTAVTVHGTTGHFLPSVRVFGPGTDPAPAVIVPVGDLWFSVAGLGLSQSQLVDIANEIAVNPNIDVAWVGGP